MKRILEVLTPDCDYAEGPEVAVAEISETLKTRIQQLATAAMLLGVFDIREYSYYPEFFMRDHEHETEDGPIIPRSPAGEDEEMACRVDGMTLVVTPSEFYWNGYIKHTDIRVETKSIPLSDLGIAPEPAAPAFETLKKVEASICTGSINNPAIQQVALKDIRKSLLQSTDPLLAVVLEGGLVQSVVTNAPTLAANWGVMVIDYDTEGAGSDEITLVPQDDGSKATAIAHIGTLSEAGIDLQAVWKALNE